jgi:hypothetical protein
MIPTNEHGLRDAVNSGRLREDEHTDFKRELPGGDRGSAAIAVDLASFAIGGGTIVVGIDEGPPAVLSPIELRGQRERVAQIARSSVDPPLRVVIREIVSDADPALGWLAIEVPPSPDAPHAVGGAFRGRSGTTNTILTASEVRRLHEQFAEAAPPPLLDELRVFVSLDPTQEEQRQQAHLFVLARPLRAPDEMLNDAVGDYWEAWTRDHILNAPRLTRQFSPDFAQAHRLVRTPTGWIATHYDAVHQPPEPLRENYGIEVEIGDDGSIRLFCSRASDQFKGTRVIFEVLIGGLVGRVVDLAAVISDDTGFVGDWEIGVALTNLRGAVSHFRMDNWWMDAEDCTPYPDFGHERTWRGSAEELVQPASIVARLLGPLNRVLNDGKCPMPVHEP